MKAFLLIHSKSIWNDKLSNIEKYMQTHDNNSKEKYVEEWKCYNKNVAIGDRIFVRSVKYEKEGLMAAGHAITKNYLDADGNSNIKVEFDWILDPQKNEYIRIDDLKKKFPKQDWNNRRSGIEIKDEYVKKLEIMWANHIGIKNDIHNLMSACDDIEPSQHDGSYELVSAAVAAYSNLADLSKININDIEFIYGMATIHTQEAHLKYLQESNLDDDTKEKLKNIINSIWEKAKNNQYDNFANNKNKIGMFGIGRPLLARNGNKQNMDCQIIITSLIKILKTENESEIYEYLTLNFPKKIDSFNVGSFSAIAHCLKPEMFPIINNKNNIFPLLDINYKKPNNIVEYVKVSQQIHQYIAQNYNFKNLRVVDLLAMELFETNENDSVIIDEEMSKKYDDVTLNTILYGAPGTGKTYLTKYYAVAICDNISLAEVRKMDEESLNKRYKELVKEKRIAFTTFHKSYDYEEFIGGLKPVIDEKTKELLYKPESGIFKNFCENVDSKEKYVFIIDEINRGDISRIFGELITLIEESKRLGEKDELTVTLPYFKTEFGVPNNVYILGTMNTADRSIALIDTALRRRFNFIEMLPDYTCLEKIIINNIDIKKLLETINNRIIVLYDREHVIGHAYFMSLKENPTFDQLKLIFKQTIMPLLQEYFYEDYAKIAQVLGDNIKTDKAFKFIGEVDTSTLNYSLEEDNIPEKIYFINEEAFDNVESYLDIYR